MTTTDTTGEVEIVMIPVSWSMSREQAMFVQGMGKMDEVRAGRITEMNEAKRELAAFLSNGYSLVCSHTLESDNRTFIVYTLFKKENGE